MATILSSPLFLEIVWPFVLVFTVIFAILQKTEILGKGKRQIDALVAATIGLITTSFGYATGVIVSIVPFLAVAAVVILIFMILYGMTFGVEGEGKFKLHKGIQRTIGALAAIGVIAVTLYATGGWTWITDWFDTGDQSGIIANVLVVGLIVIAFVVVLIGDRSSEKKDKKD